MATKHSLQPNEVVLLKELGVMHGGRMASYSDELILTNLNLVLMKKGMFGNSKGTLIFPLNQIKVHNGRAQALIGKSANGADALEVYFLNGQEAFSFGSGGKKKLNEWISRINIAVTGTELPTQDPGSALPGADLVANVVKDTLGVFKSKFGAKSTAPQQVAGKCRSCGAPVTGFEGQAIACDYCGSSQRL